MVLPAAVHLSLNGPLQTRTSAPVRPSTGTNHV